MPLLLGAGYTAETNYVLHCQGCHGADGIGGVPDQIPPLRDSVGYFLHIPDGRRFLIQVPGVAQAPINDTQVAELLNYILHRYGADQLPDAFAPYTREEVARERRRAVDVLALRAELVSALRDRLGVRIWTLEDPIVAPQHGRLNDARD